MIDIVFVNQFDWEISNDRVLPLGLLSLSHILRTNGFSAKICDFNSLYHQGKIKLSTNYHINVERMVEYLDELKPCIVSFYTMANNYHIALSICERLKEHNFKVITVLAGPQATAVATQTLERFPQVDLVSIGEGELTISNIVKHLKKYGLNDLANVDGIAFRNGHRVDVNAKKEWIDVDKLPFLDFSDMDNYDNLKMDVLEMELGRGCPFNCTYCSTSRFWGRNYRIKSVDRVVQEIKKYQKQYGTHIFLFQHDLFTCNKKYVLALCNRFIIENLQIKWACYARLDVIDEEMIRVMARAGCIKLFFGLETGSPKIQAAVKKNLDVDKIFSIMKVLSECGIRITISFIYGFPQEECGDLEQTLSLMYAIKEKSYILNSTDNWVDMFASMLIFFANTEITDEYFNQLVFDTTFFESMNTQVPLPMDVMKIIRENKAVFPQYFLVPKMVDKKYRYLSSFANGIFSSFYYTEHDLVRSAINLYSGNILALYSKTYHDSPQDIELLYDYSLYHWNEPGIIATLHSILIRCIEER